MVDYFNYNDQIKDYLNTNIPLEKIFFNFTNYNINDMFKFIKNNLIQLFLLLLVIIIIMIVDKINQFNNIFFGLYPLPNSNMISNSNINQNTISFQKLEIKKKKYKK